MSNENKVTDFEKLKKTADDLVSVHGLISVMIDARNFHGWESFSAVEAHFNFVKEHHHKVNKIAIIIGSIWQYGMAAMANVFVHPKIKSFQFEELDKARQWLFSK